jgi:hypothetical protein
MEKYNDSTFTSFHLSSFVCSGIFASQLMV